MKNLTEEEFKDRVRAIGRARQIFMKSGITNDISVAFVLYQEVLANRNRILHLTDKALPDEKRSIKEVYDPLQKYIRPKCKECGHEMGLRAVTTPKGPANRHGWRSAWECPECAYEEYSTLERIDQIRKLERKDAAKKSTS